MFFCSKCNHKTRLFFKLVSHYRFIHASEHGFTMTCSIDGCEKKYSNVDSFLKHAKRKHKVFHQTHFSKFREKNRSNIILDALVQVDDEIESDQEEALQDVDVINDISEIDFQKKFGIFFLSLREKYKLPSVVLPHIINEFITMICHHQAQISNSISQFVVKYQLGENESNSLRQIIEERSYVECALSNLDTEYKINKFARFKLNYVKPVEYKPNRNQKDTYQYVPILETIRNLLSHDDVFSYVVNSHKSVDGKLRDFCDGEMFSGNPIFRDNPSALQIMLFFDEFTAVNPLGHQVKSYKIGGFYMILGNLPPKFRSQLYCIQLVALCMSSTIKSNGYEKVLEPLINDLKILETDGIKILKADQEYELFGTVSVVIADNLGAHSLGGFMESFRTLRNCRFCFINREDMQEKFDCNNLNIRTVQMYNEQARLVKDDPNLASVYGVKASSTLNNLNNYHVINGMPSDLAHDLFEGVVCEVMKNVIKHCVTAGYFDLEELNEQILGFKFSEIDKSNKPSKVSQVLRTFKVSQSAAQMWCFVRHLPLMVGKKIPVNDREWECLMLLRDLLLYVCAPALDRGHVFSMEDVIEEFHVSYRACFPDETVKPKFHYTLHYPRLTLLFGPLIHLQTLRFEGKHNYFKELVYRSKNRKNLCKSLAERHQYYQCTFNNGGKYLSDGKVDSSSGSTVPFCLLNDQFQEQLRGIIHGEDIFLCKSVTYFGITYWINTCVVTGVQGFLYQFSKIVNCAIIQGIPFLLCQKLNTIGFERHYHAYAVGNTNQFEVRKVSDLLEINPLGIYQHPRNPQVQHRLVILKWKVLF